MDGGTLTLGSNFTTANINQPSLTRAAGSQVILTGNLDNTGAVLDAIGEIHLSGGTITGGTSRVDIHATYDTEEVLDGLTLEGDLKLESNQDQITITGGLVLDGTLDVAGHDAIVYFEGTQTLSELGGGTATMMMTGHTWAPDYVRVYATGGGVDADIIRRPSVPGHHHRCRPAAKLRKRLGALEVDDRIVARDVQCPVQHQAARNRDLVLVALEF